MNVRRYGLRGPTLYVFLLLIAIAVPVVAQTMTVSPKSVVVPVGGDRRLVAYVNGSPSNSVSWSVDGMVGGNSVVGFIDSTGRYVAPSTPPAGWTVTATARSTTNPASAASCLITVRNQVPSPTTLTPNPLPVGPFTLQVAGSRFVDGAQVLWNGAPLATTFTSPTSLTATGTAGQAGLIKIAVANPGPGAPSSSLTLKVIPKATVAPTRTVTRPASTPTMIPTATSSKTATSVPTTEPSRTPTPTRMATAAATATLTQPRTSTPTMVQTATQGTVATATQTRTEPSMTPTMVQTATQGTTSTPTPMRTEPSRTATMIGTATSGASTPTKSPSTARTATPTLTPQIAVSVAPPATTLLTGATQQFQATVSGNPNQAVTWNVNGTVGGDPSVGTITPNGLYTAPAAVPPAGSVTIAAVSAANGTSQGSALVTIQNPLAITHGRFLDQSTFGPTQQLTAHLAQVGIPAFIDEQFAMPESAWPPLATAQRSDAIDAFFGNALSGQDQLRQRVIFALSEIIVEAMNKNTNGDEIVPWLQLLSRNAFGNYRTLLKEITLDASMGKYLDLANSGVMGGAANENYPREVMQLFSIGLYQLNLDGSVKVDAQNIPLATYTQTDVQQLAKALTGWTYGNSTGTAPASGNYSYYPGPMLSVASKHNTTAKTILGQPLPANQTAQQDLDGAINIIFNHANVGPFLATRLTRALITSNPSPAYIARVATAFNDNGSGVRGDMKAVIRAILLDAEARNDSPPSNFGRLRTPVQHTIALARALGLNVGAASQFAYLFYNMNEGMLDAASVFGHYSPSYRIPKTALFGPEFQIYSASDAINRANWFYSLLYNPWPINPALQPFVALAGNATALVNAVDNALLYGRMSQSTRTALLTALPAMPDNNARTLTALYLAATSGEYLVQR